MIMLCGCGMVCCGGMVCCSGPLTMLAMAIRKGSGVMPIGRSLARRGCLRDQWRDVRLRATRFGATAFGRFCPGSLERRSGASGEARAPKNDPGGDRTHDPVIKSHMLYH